jgi:hypothetical protein
LLQGEKSTLIFIALVVATSGHIFASSTASCSVEPLGVPPATSVTNSGSDEASCSFSGPTASGLGYVVSAGGFTSASGGSTGSIQAYAGANVEYDGYGNFAGSVSTESSLVAEFTSAGPPRLGSIYIQSDSYFGNNSGGFQFYGASNSYTGVIITQGSFSYEYDCLISDSTVCNGRIVPIYLGVPFPLARRPV